MSARHTQLDTALGLLTLTAEHQALTGLYFPDHRYPPERDLGVAVRLEDDAVFAAAETELRKYLSGHRNGFSVPVAPRGSEFARRVWALLREIPRGETNTYGALATQLGNRHLAQRVGQVVAHNPVSIIIPCHRVVGADGSLTGYAGGLWRKRALLELEEPPEIRDLRLF